MFDVGWVGAEVEGGGAEEEGEGKGEGGKKGEGGGKGEGEEGYVESEKKQTNGMRNAES